MTIWTKLHFDPILFYFFDLKNYSIFLLIFLIFFFQSQYRMSHIKRKITQKTPK